MRISDEGWKVSIDEEHDVKPRLVVADLDARTLKRRSPVLAQPLPIVDIFPPVVFYPDHPAAKEM